MPAPATLQAFQRDFGRRIRNPRAPLPAGVPTRRMAAYQELLFNNLCGFLDRCFPVGRACLGEARWRRLCRAFFRDWPCTTPWFRDIPQEFVTYLQQGQPPRLPRWFAELAHYEWAELAVDVADHPVPRHDPAGDLLDGRPLLNPALLLLACQWPVQRISPQWRPRRPQPVQLAVLRRADDSVGFVQLTPASFRLLQLLQTQPGRSGRAAILQLLAELEPPASDALLTFGQQALAELRGLGLILGSHHEH